MIYNLGNTKLPGYSKNACHIMFDIKTDSKFMTKLSPEITYVGIISRDSVQIAYTISALNNIAVLSCNITNKYLKMIHVKKNCGSTEHQRIHVIKTPEQTLVSEFKPTQSLMLDLCTMSKSLIIQITFSVFHINHTNHGSLCQTLQYWEFYQ